MLQTKHQERVERKQREYASQIQTLKQDYEEQFRVFKDKCQGTVNSTHNQKEAEKAENLILRGQVKAFREKTETQSQEIESLKARLSQLESSPDKSPREQGEMDHREGRRKQQAKHTHSKHSQSKQPQAKHSHGKQPQAKHPAKGKQAKGKQANGKHSDAKHSHGKQHPTNSKKKHSQSKSRHQSHNSDDSD